MKFFAASFMRPVLSALCGLLVLTSAAEGAEMTEQNTEQNWDKVFAKSEKVDVQKVSFKNRYGITLVGDLYLPKGKKAEKLPAIAVSGPFGAVKEQSSGLYAQTMAERGFITLVTALHRLALCQQRAAGKQLFFCGDGALDGAVINEHIGVFDAGVKVLQRDIHGGKAVAAVGKVCKNIFAPGHADHLRHIVSAFAHSGKAAGSNGEKRAAFAGGGLFQQWRNALRLPGEHLLGKGFFPQ